MAEQPNDKIFALMYRKAAAGEDVEVECSSESTAKNMRFQGYAFAKRAREAKVPDFELIEAINAVSLSVAGKTLIVRGKVKYEGMQALIKALGGEEAVNAQLQPSTEDREIAASQERMRKMLEGGN